MCIRDRNYSSYSSASSPGAGQFGRRAWIFSNSLHPFNYCMHTNIAVSATDNFSVTLCIFACRRRGLCLRTAGLEAPHLVSAPHLTSLLMSNAADDSFEPGENPRSRWRKFQNISVSITNSTSAKAAPAKTVKMCIRDSPTLSVAFLMVVTVWSFCRFYYFAFYVMEHYVDPSYRFSGLVSFARYLIQKKASARLR